MTSVRRQASPDSGQKDPARDDGGWSSLCIGDRCGNQMSILDDGVRDHEIIELLCLGCANGENAGDHPGAVAVYRVGPGLRSRDDIALASGGSGKGLIHDECSGKIALSVHVALGKCDGNVGAVRTDDCVVPLQTGKVKAGLCVLSVDGNGCEKRNNSDGGGVDPFLSASHGVDLLRLISSEVGFKLGSLRLALGVPHGIS